MKLLVVSNFYVTLIDLLNIFLRTVLILAGAFWMSDMVGTTTAVLIFVAHLAAEALVYRFGDDDIVYLKPGEEPPVDENNQD